MGVGGRREHMRDMFVRGGRRADLESVALRALLPHGVSQKSTVLLVICLSSFHFFLFFVHCPFPFFVFFSYSVVAFQYTTRLLVLADGVWRFRHATLEREICHPIALFAVLLRTCQIRVSDGR